MSAGPLEWEGKWIQETDGWKFYGTAKGFNRKKFDPATVPEPVREQLRKRLAELAKALAPSPPEFIITRLTQLTELLDSHSKRTPEEWARVHVLYAEELSDVPPDLIEEAFRRAKRYSWYPKIGEFRAPIEAMLKIRQWERQKIRELLGD